MRLASEIDDILAPSSERNLVDSPVPVELGEYSFRQVVVPVGSGETGQALFQSFMEDFGFVQNRVRFSFECSFSLQENDTVIVEIIQEETLFHAKKYRQPFQSGKLRVVQVAGSNVIRVVFGQLAQVLFQRLLGDGHLPLGQQGDDVHFLYRALAGDVKLTNGIDLITEELHAHGSFRAGCEEVH